MKESTIKNKHITTYVREFGSLSEFYDYLTTSPFNPNWYNPSLRAADYLKKQFAGTNSFQEAVDLMKNGWHEEAMKLTQKLKAQAKDTQIKTKARPTYSVQGFQCSVPRYLQGLPDSMINKKNVPVKDKVITINKVVSVSAFVTKEQIEAESVKALALINNIEAQGYRCNLNVLSSVSAGTSREMVKVRIKSANERLNITKMAFPLVHPSMNRRLMFRYLEVTPTATKDYVHGYGAPNDTKTIKGLLDQLGNENEYVIPLFLPADINTVESLKNL